VGAYKNSGESALMCVVGARPNFMKIAPIMDALRTVSGRISASLIHTGQHYDVEMDRGFFDQLGIPRPDLNLEVGSATHAQQTAEIMRRFEPVLDKISPDAVLVVGDVNSTVACALVAAKKGVRVVHVEAGLRSYDRSMPEEINRVLTDQISDLLFTTENDALHNLQREGIDPVRVHFVGNVMIDTLLKHLPDTRTPTQILRSLGVDVAGVSGGYTLLTLHRPSNVDDPAILTRLLETVAKVGEETPVIFPVHPRTRAALDKAGLQRTMIGASVLCLPPLGYMEMLGLMSKAVVVMTDSGGVQEETTALGIPCLTLRDNTERPITVDSGTNTLVGNDPERILRAFDDIMRTGGKRGRVPELWDGRAAQRIVSVLDEWLQQ
jgi:UDP-N-acetylglucosamine 2-epimerase (non-hydrolysing)